MRLLPAVVAAVGLFAGHVRGQHRNGVGLMDRLAPRAWYEGVAGLPMLVERDGSCASGQHPCSDVNSTSCCANTEYCIINNSWEVQCCAIGSNCSDDTVCDAERYPANETITTTTTASASLTAVTTITEVVCSGRSCSGSFYGCPSSLGGHCCGFGQDCATNTAGSGICIGVASSTSATTTTGSSTATSTGGGLPTGAVVEHKSQGLSTGAKAGIAVGVVVVAAIVIGALTWLCLRRRRSARSETTATAQELPSMTPAGRPGAVALPHNMSEADAHSYRYTPSSTGLSRGGGGPGVAAQGGDYFGEIGGGGGGGSPPSQYQQQQQHNQAQPRHSPTPHGPDNVLAPVEIGTTRASLRRRPPATEDAAHAHARAGSQGGYSDGSQSELAATSPRGPSAAAAATWGPGAGAGPASPVDSIAGRFELYGDYGHGTPASGHEMFYDAQEGENVGGGQSPRGTTTSRAVGASGTSGTLLRQPFPTPGSEMSEFGTPSPMSREEEAHPRRM